MSREAWITLAVHLPLLYWLVVVDGFRTWNEWADLLESYLPEWAQWNTQGDRISWFQHGAVALGVSLYGGIWSLVLPESFTFGAAFGGWIAFLCYVVREAMSARMKWGSPNAWTHPTPNRVGWAVDGLCDVVGPLAVALAWTVL